MDSSASDVKSSPTLIKRKKYVKKYSKKKDKYSNFKHANEKERLVSISAYERRNESSRRSSEYGQFWSTDYREKRYKSEGDGYKNENYLFKRQRYKYFEPSRGKKWYNYADRSYRSHSSRYQLYKDGSYSKREGWSHNSKRDHFKEVRSPEIDGRKLRLRTSRDKNIEPKEESKQRDSSKEIDSKRKSSRESSRDIESIHSKDSPKECESKCSKDSQKDDTSKIVNLSSSEEEPIINDKTTKSVVQVKDKHLSKLYLPQESEFKPSRDSIKENISKTVTLISSEEEPATNDTAAASKSDGQKKEKKLSKLCQRQESSIDHYSYLIESDSSSEKSDLEEEMRSNSSDTSDNEDYNLKPQQNNETDITMQSKDDEKHSDSSPVNGNTPQPKVEIKELPSYFPAIQGSRFVEEYHRLNRIEEGTYGVVYRARDKRTDEIVALKRLKMEKEREGFPITSLREINTILKAQHPNIVTVREIVVGCNMDKIYIVMDFVEHDLKSLMETMKQPFLVGEVKTLMIQLLRGVQHLHDNWIIHRDIKTSNLLLSHKGILKVGDFGLAREYGSPLKPYTPVVVTLWYRAPELLLGIKEYSTAIDLWSVGCVFVELLTMKALFPGKSEIDQINRIFHELGTPNENIWPGYNDLPYVKKWKFFTSSENILRKRFGTEVTNLGFDLIAKFLTYNPSVRITAANGLKHGYFLEPPMPIKSSLFPTWPAKSEQMPRNSNSSPKPPSGGKQFAKQLENDDDDILLKGFHFDSTAKAPAFSLKF